jgi:predicted PurR-regulated permease PerM
MRQSQNTIISIFFIALLLFIFYEVLHIFSPFIQPLFWAAIISFGFYPLHEKIKSRLKNQEAAATVTTLIILLTFVPLVIFLFASLLSEAFKLYDWGVAFIHNGGHDRLTQRILSHPWSQKVRVVYHWGVIQENYKSWMSASASRIGNLAATQLGTITKNIFVSMLHFLLTFFIVFFFLRDGHKIYRFIYDITPLEERNKKNIFHQIKETFTAVIHGQLLTAAVQAILAGIIFWVLGVPLPIFFAALTLVAALIPIVGAPVIWLPLAIYLAATQHYVEAGFLFFLGAGVISLVDNILKPVLIGEKTKLPYIVLFLGILGGVQVFGLVGIFLAPAILSLFFALIKIYREKYL